METIWLGNYDTAETYNATWYRLWKVNGVTKWGECGGFIHAPADTDITVTLPISFSTNWYTLVFGHESSGATPPNLRHLGLDININNYKTVSSFITRCSTSYFKYFYACGPV